MAGTLFSLPKQVPLDGGDVVPAGKLYFYLTGTTTAANVYTTPALDVAHSNPVEADSEGVFPPIYLDPSVWQYRVKLTDSSGVQIYQVDTLPSSPQNYPRTAAEVSAAVTPTDYGYRELDVHRYGAIGDGIADDGQALVDALAVADATGRGGMVRLGIGTYLTSQQLIIPNACGIEGVTAASSEIKAASNFSAASLIKNESQNGTQEYAYLRNLTINGNAGGGAVCSTAVVDFVSLFVDSYIKGCIIQNGSAVNLHLGANAAGGPVLVEGCWILSAASHNVLIDEDSGNTGAVSGYELKNCTIEHQGGGYSGIKIKGYGQILGVYIRDCHIEQANAATANTYALHLDGAANVCVDGLDILSASSSGGGIRIENNGYSVRYSFRHVSNTNLINPIINDLKENVSLGLGLKAGYYCSSDIGIFTQQEQALTYGTTVTPNLALGNYCTLAVSNTTAFTIANPTNFQVGETLWLEITNASGGAMGAITWGAAFGYREAWTNPANGYRKLISFRRRADGNWIQATKAIGDF